MNKSIIKHELRSLKWIFAVGLLINIIILAVFNQNINFKYINIFNNGLTTNTSIFNLAFFDTAALIVVAFMALVISQVHIQFQSEKRQEVSRFIKVLPIRDEALSINKIILGILNISILFVILYLGLLVIKHNNMFWVEDIYNTSNIRDYLISFDQLIYPLFLAYLVSVCLYTFLVMIQYMVNSNLGGLIIGILTWFAPMFIMITLKTISSYYSVYIDLAWEDSFWLNPSFYMADTEYLLLGQRVGVVVNKLNLHYLLTIIFIIVNIIVAVKLSGKKLIEDDNKLIPLKSARVIFVVGVTICSALLASYVYLSMLDYSYYVARPTISLIIGGLIGFVVSRKISKIN